MSTIKGPSTPSDPCPACGSAFRELPAPTAEQRSAAANRENPSALPAGTDNATEAQRAELGALFVCSNCGYKTRIKTDTDGNGDSARPQTDPETNGSSSAGDEAGARGSSDKRRPRAGA